MDTLKSVIEQAMKRNGCATPHALGAQMNLKLKFRVSDWIAGRRWPSEREAAQLALLAGVHFGELIAIMEMEKAKTPEDRAFWKNFKAHGIAASLALVSVAASPALLTLVESVYYVKWCIQRLRPCPGNFGLFRTA